jgi:hypothetical protein
MDEVEIGLSATDNMPASMRERSVSSGGGS